MFRRLFPLVVVLTCFPGGFSKQSPAEPTVVQAGRVAILPCYFSEYDDPLFVEWSEESLHPNVVLLYREGKEEHGMKSEAFRYRASLVRPEMDNSDKSLRIADVQLSDEGNYTCKSNLNNKVRNVTTVGLSVVAMSSPELTLVQSTNGATVQCEVQCSPCELEMEFLDDEGNVLLSHQQRFPSEESGFLNVTQRMLVPDHITRVTCRVTQKKINQTWLQTLSVPDYCKVSCSPSITTTIIVCVVVAIIIIIIITIIVFKCWISRDDPHSSKASLQSSTSSVNRTTENIPLIDDMDGSKVKSNPPTGDRTHQQQQDKRHQLSPVRCDQPAQASAASSSTTSTGNAAPQVPMLPQAPKQKPEVDVPPSKPDNRKHTGKTKRSSYDCSAVCRPNNSKPHNPDLTVPLWSRNRYAALSDYNS
ncbi:butyrophilin-like protein 1 [Nelusetta ayraudi]|uniref:butyrophilin-like protein 1 n=1 Tax=Nelusetta ayraudi TaxID=303726 RepID=UPI003F702A66